MSHRKKVQYQSVVDGVSVRVTVTVELCRFDIRVKVNETYYHDMLLST